MDMDIRFHDRTTKYVNPSGTAPVVDPRFNKEKARRFDRASVVSEIEEESVVSEEGWEIEPSIDEIEMSKALEELEESEESNADDIDI